MTSGKRSRCCSRVQACSATARVDSRTRLLVFAFRPRRRYQISCAVAYRSIVMRATAVTPTAPQRNGHGAIRFAKQCSRGTQLRACRRDIVTSLLSSASLPLAAASVQPASAFELGVSLPLVYTCAMHHIYERANVHKCMDHAAVSDQNGADSSQVAARLDCRRTRTLSAVCPLITTKCHHHASAQRL